MRGRLASVPGVSNTTPNWYADPSSRHEYRWWDGQRWTDAVSSHGRQSSDPLMQGPMPVQSMPAQRIQQDVMRAGAHGGPAPTGGGIFDQRVLVVNQKAKLIEVNNEYTISDQSGMQIGAVRQVGQSALKKAVRVLSSYDQFMTHKLQVVDQSGVVLLLTRPAKLVKSRVLVANGAGHPIGEIKQRNAIGKIRFGFEVNGQEVGSLNAENWRAWNFAILDHAGTEVARITKTWEGLAKTLFTTADNYVVQIHYTLPEPLRSLTVAAALAVDTALKQDSRGFG